MSRIYALSLIAFLGLGASASWAGSKTFDKSFTAPPGGRLVVDAEDGSVTVVGHDSRDLTVHADIRGTEQFVITAEQTDTGVTVRGRTHFRWYNVAFNYSIVHITIEVPRDYPVELKSSDGHLDVSQVSAGIQGGTSDGRIQLRDISGAIDLRTSDGSITAENIKGATRLRTSDGSITVSHVVGDVDVQTSDGHVELTDIDGKISAETSDGRMSIEARANHGISARSEGRLTVRLPANVQANLTAEAGDGHVRSDFPVTVVTQETSDSNSLSGQINGGGEAISLKTSDGNITIEKL